MHYHIDMIEHFSTFVIVMDATFLTQHNFFISRLSSFVFNFGLSRFLYVRPIEIVHRAGVSLATFVAQVDGTGWKHRQYTVSQSCFNDTV